MKREILYRGKRVDNGEWVEGYYAMCELSESVYIICDFFETIYTDRLEEVFCFGVNPETVGQFTGLKDKNGKKIFERMLVNNSFIIDICSEKVYLMNILTGDIRSIDDENELEITGEYTEILEDAQRVINKHLQQAKISFETKRIKATFVYS